MDNSADRHMVTTQPEAAEESEEEDLEEKELTPKEKNKRRCKAVIRLLLVMAVVTTFLYFAWTEMDKLTDLVADWFAENIILGAICIILLLVVANVCFLPVNTTNKIATVIFTKVFNHRIKGFLFSATISTIGMMLGTAVVYFISRICCHERIQKFLNKHQKKKKWVRNIKIIDSVSFKTFC